MEEYIVESWQREDHLYVGNEHSHKESGSDEEDKNVAAYYDVTETEDALGKEKETSQSSLECPHCGKKFELKNSLSNHIKSHSDFRQFQCQDCGRRFKKEGDYQRHRHLCGTAHKYMCEICQKTFMNMNSLTNHTRVHNDEKPFQCGNCSTAFKKQGDMKNHEVVCKSGVLPFKCPICQKEFAAANTLANHMLVHQEHTTTLDCSKCGRKFRKPGSHLKHEAHCQQTPSFTCSRCDARFPSQEQLRRHSKNHIGERFHCNICEKTFTHSNGFAQHKKSHIEERLRCPNDDCGQEFKTVHNLKKHCKLHEEPGKLDCHICGRKFAGTWNLKRHVMTHSGVRPFKCDSCPKRFTSEKDMEAHRLGHSGQKGFQCELCPSSFTHLRGLQQHVNIHTEKALSCEKGCGRRFVGKTQQETHMEKCRGSVVATGMTQDDLIFRCNICSAQFSDYQRVEEHIGKHREQNRGEGQDVVISIEGMAEVEEETFTEEINTFVISVDADGNESGTCVAEPSIKYTLVE